MIGVYERQSSSDLTLFDIAAVLGYAVSVGPDGSLASAQDGVDLPTDEELEAKRSEAWAIIEARRYKPNRRVAYPSVAEQLDLLFHDITNGTLDTTGEFYTALKAVKDAYPKPEA